MRYLSLISFFFFFLCSQNTFSQVCAGTLGDAVAGTDFGTGNTTFGSPIPTNTSYTYVAGTPNDGQYTIAKNTIGTYSSWMQDLTNHTPNDPDGYMMIVNADINKGIFYQTTINNLCPNTTYEFASYIINLYRNTGGIRPNVKFTIENNGTSIKEFTTGDILEGTSTGWVKYGTIFTTPANVGIITLKMTNENPGGQGNDLALDDITFRACGSVITSSLNNGNGSSASLCQGSSGSFNLTTTVSSGYTDPQFQWQTNNGTGWVNIPGETNTQTTVNFTNAVTGKYDYRLLAAEGLNINSPNCRVASSPVTITVNAIPVALATNKGPVCIGNSVQLNASGGSSYTWTGPNGYSSTLQNPIIANTTANITGTYTVTVTNNNCSATAQTDVQILPPVNAATSFSTATVCENAQVMLSASGGSIYSWLPVDGLSDPTLSNPVFTAKNTITYTVTAGNGACFATADVTVNVIKNATANAGADRTLLNGQVAQLQGKVTGDQVTYFWTPTDYLDNPNSLNPIASPPTDILYTLHAQSNAGCLSATDEVFIKVYPKIVIPNSFSPNNDNVNDTWNIPATEAFQKPIVKVTNRYGQLIFQSEGTFKGWDGKFKGKDLPPATYYYSVYFNEYFATYTGWLMLIR